MDPKAALDGKTCAAWHRSQWLGDRAAQLKPRTATECSPAAGDHTARNGESATVLRQDRS